MSVKFAIMHRKFFVSCLGHSVLIVKPMFHDAMGDRYQLFSSVRARRVKSSLYIRQSNPRSLEANMIITAKL